jgi:hypothetical protein
MRRREQYGSSSIFGPVSDTIGDKPRAAQIPFNAIAKVVLNQTRIHRAGGPGQGRLLGRFLRNRKTAKKAA